MTRADVKWERWAVGGRWYVARLGKRHMILVRAGAFALGELKRSGRWRWTNKFRVEPRRMRETKLLALAKAKTRGWVEP